MSRVKIASLALSASALVGLAVFEGYSPTTYLDIVGIPTIGFGTTGKDVKAGQKIDPVAALQRKLSDIQKFEGALKTCVKVPLHQHEYDAYLQLAYNIGPGNFCSSTLVKKLNAEDYKGACQEILRWNRAGGKVVRGLSQRREKEYRLCTGTE